MADEIDVLIVGAGLSGIGAAVHLRRLCPDRSFTQLERRQAIGGTWDIFRYPGIRSDSDMHTLGYSFKPWRDAKAIVFAPGTDNADTSGLPRILRGLTALLIPYTRRGWAFALLPPAP